MFSFLKILEAGLNPEITMRFNDNCCQVFFLVCSLAVVLASPASALPTKESNVTVELVDWLLLSRSYKET